MVELLQTKEVIAAILGGVVASLVLLVGGFWLYLHNEKKRQRIEIFTKLAAIPMWTTDPRASELLSAIPTAFSGRSDDRVRIAYRNYHGSLNPYLSVVWVWEQSQWLQRAVYLFSDQTVFRRDLIRELAIASGWMSRRLAADFDFASLAISLVVQGQVPPVVPASVAPAVPATPASAPSLPAAPPVASAPPPASVAPAATVPAPTGSTAAPTSPPPASVPIHAVRRAELP
jgi:hypothetical protein